MVLHELFYLNLAENPIICFMTCFHCGNIAHY